MSFECPNCHATLNVTMSEGRGQGGRRSGGGGGSVDIRELKSLLSQIEDAAMLGELDAESEEFFSRTKARLDEWGDRIQMSPKQMAWLRKLAAKAGVD